MQIKDFSDSCLKCYWLGLGSVLRQFAKNAFRSLPLVWCLYVPNGPLTQQKQLTQRGMCNSGACLKAQ